MPPSPARSPVSWLRRRLPPARPRSERCSRPASADDRHSPRVPRLRRLGPERRDDRRGCECAVEGVERDRGQLVRAQRKLGGNARHLLAQRGPGDGAVIGRDRDAHAGAMQPGERVVRDPVDDAGLDIRGGAQVERDVARAELLEEGVVLGGAHAVCHAPHAEIKDLANALRSRDLAGVRGEPEPSLARRDERDGVRWRRPESLRAGEIEADHRSSELGGGPSQDRIGRRRVGAHGGHDQADERRARSAERRRAGDAHGDRLDDIAHAEPAFEVEPRRPSDLGVRDPVRGQVLHQLARRSLERFARLEQRDREVEETEELRLVATPGRTDHAAAGLVQAEGHVDLGRELDGRLGAERPIEVLVQLRLRKRAERVGIHRLMIGIRRLLPAIVVAALLVGALGGGGPRPEIEIGARRLVAERAARADETLARLSTALEPAVDAARSGAARVVAGDEAPGIVLAEAADLIASAEDEAADARRAVAAMEAARGAWNPDGDPVAPATERGELGSIAAQLEGSGAAADEFASMRLRAAAIPGTLADALGALETRDVDQARILIDAARESHDIVAAWDVGLVTLPIWVETTDEMIGAVERILDATERGDDGAASVAAAEFAALSVDGATADRALRIAMAEGGSAVTSTPLGRLAAVLSSIGELRATLASIRETMGQ